VNTTDRPSASEQVSATVPWRVRLAVAGATFLVVGLVALVAAWARPGDPWAAALVFGACAVGPVAGLAWLVLAHPHVHRPNPHDDEGVEARWAEQAASGTCIDLLVAAGLALTVVSVVDADLPAQPVLVALVVLGLADLTLRHVLVSRRES
jgi:dipeptide/tripeptide permease